MIRKFLSLSILLLSTTAVAQSLRTTTSLASESGNNTSAIRGTPQNGNAEPGNVSKLSLRTLLYPGATTRILVRYMPWFGDERHVGVGYRSDDPSEVAHQVDDMVGRGIDGAIVDWYGPAQAFKNRSTELLLHEAERHGGQFSVGISYDAGSLKECVKRGCDATGQLISDLTWAAKHFYGSPAYLRFNGRPLVTFFGLEKSEIDWNRVRRQIPGNPLLVFRNSGAFRLPFSDGGFSWIAPETAKSSDAEGFEYLERFHQAAHEHPGMFAMASAYKGFDDSIAGWGKGRRIEQNCGRTWLRSFGLVNKGYSSTNQLSALIIPTWNDYEEGTEIESGIDNCVRLEARLDGNRLRWQVNGPAETLDHFVLFASNDGEQLAKIAEVPGSAREARLSEINLPPGQYRLFVKAIAKPSLLSRMSGPVQFTRTK